MMFRETRRSGRVLKRKDAAEMLERAPHGTLAVLGDGGYPYSVPVSFAFEDDKIYIHGACSGHKIDSVKKDPKVSFSVVEQDDICPEKFTTYYRSAIVFGKARIAGEKEKRAGKEAILMKYAPGYKESGMKYIESAWNDFSVIVIDIEHMTAKAGN